MIVEPAELTWDASGAPFNTRYDDIYSSRDAANEVLRAFIDPAGIPDKFANGIDLTVAELGFGTGLNFVTLADLAKRAGRRLHFISAELHPLRPTDLARLRGRCPESARSLMDALIEQWPPLLAGWHRRELADGQIVLSLWFGDVADFLLRLEQDHAYGIDAWFLDGFAPDRNPAMWRDAAFQHIAASSRTGATVTTFTSVGRVRRGLESAGFDMRRVDQRPFKRESLAGVLRRSGRAATSPQQVQVVGAGIAGCSLAAHFARRGTEVRLLEPYGRIAMGASMMCAAQHSRLLADGSPIAAWRAASHLYSEAFTRRRDGVNPTGLVQLPGPNADLERLERLFACYAPSGDWLRWSSREEITDVAGRSWAPATSGLWYPDAPVVNLDRLCHDLIETPGIRLEFSQQVESDIPVIWCNAQGIAAVSGFETIPLHMLWGQADIVELGEPPRTGILGDGYVLPFAKNCIVGSTYEYTPWDPEKATTTNLARINSDTVKWRGRMRASRLTTSDRMPLIGKLGAHWVSTAHGSMGATSAHLAASVVQSLVMGWVPPVTPEVLETVAPDRFARRASKKVSGRPPGR